jgi:copper transport protein
MTPPPAGSSPRAGERRITCLPRTLIPSRRHVRVAALVALLLALAIPPAASAHARLLSTSPQAGARLDRAPRAVTLRFDEDVETAFGALRVLAASGKRVDDGHIARPGGRGSVVSVALRRGLPSGTYTAAYRVISDEGHPVSGAFVFRAGAGAREPGEPVATLAAGAQAPPAVRQAASLNRTGSYLALALGLGTLLFLFACWLPTLREVSGAEPRWRDAAEAFAARWRALWLCSVVVGAVTAALGLVLQAATATGTSLTAALDQSVLQEVLDTHAGRGWLARLVGWMLVAVVVEVASRRRHAVPRIQRVALGADGFVVAGPSRGAVAAVGVVAALLAATPGLAGHAAVRSPVALLLPLDIVHVAAMCAWLGGLASIVILVRAAGRRLEPAERAQLLAAALTRFSPIALGSVLALAATGVAQATLHLHRLDALTGSAYGRAVAIKVALLAVLIAVGALNRQRTLPRLRAVAAGGQAPIRAARTLHKTIGGEIALLVAVLTMTGALVSYAPPAAHAARGPVEREASGSMDDLHITVAPARPGMNRIDFYAFRSSDGLADQHMRNVRIIATPPNGAKTMPLAARAVSPGHFIVTTAPLTSPGAWTLQLTGRMSGMPPENAVVNVPIR